MVGWPPTRLDYPPLQTDQGHSLHPTTRCFPPLIRQRAAQPFEAHDSPMHDAPFDPADHRLSVSSDISILRRPRRPTNPACPHPSDATDNPLPLASPHADRQHAPGAAVPPDRPCPIHPADCPPLAPTSPNDVTGLSIRSTMQADIAPRDPPNPFPPTCQTPSPTTRHGLTDPRIRLICTGPIRVTIPGHSDRLPTPRQHHSSPIDFTRQSGSDPHQALRQNNPKRAVPYPAPRLTRAVPSDAKTRRLTRWMHRATVARTDRTPGRRHTRRRPASDPPE
jgi:hypothetical protein